MIARDYEQLYAEQVLLEDEAQTIRKDKEYRDLSKAIEQGRFDETFYGSGIMKTYYPAIRNKIQEYFDSEYQGHTGKTQRYIKYLCDDVNKVAFVVLQSLVKKLAQRSNKVKSVTMANYIVQNLRVIQTFDTAEKSNPKLMSYLGSEYRRASAKRKQMLIEKHLVEFQDHSMTSTKSMDIKAGATLVDLVIHSNTNLIENKKLFRRGVDRYSTIYTMFTDSVFDILKQTYYIPPTLALFPPMIVEPMPWTGFKEGGYITVKNKFLKIKGKEGTEKLRQMDFSKPMGVINKLQSVEWRVNTKILEVIDEIHKRELIDPTSPPTLPRLYGGIPTSNPTKIEDLMEKREYKKEYNKEEKREWAIWNRKREKIAIGLDGENGRRLQYLMTIGVANKMKEYDKFYYVYQLDYRGRVYPVTDFFNPQSKGYVKAMLEFANGHHLDAEGTKWLKIHSANTYGLDKEPFKKRMLWAIANRQKMLEAAEDPLGTLGYWTKADSPFEFLAACMALREHVSGLPVHLPIQLDAVNSGIQMYSGLLRDRTGAQSTCVIGKDRSDLYQEVANLVDFKLRDNKYPPIISFMDKEGKETTIPTREEANSMIGNFTRSMTKSNVMTVPYSVSMRGMKMQNWGVMDDMKLKGKQFWTGDEWIVNFLWTTLTHEAIFDIVKGARAGQEYLKDVARLLKDVAIWHTPIYNLPVMQPAFKNKESRVQTVLGTLTMVEFTDELKRQKQLSSIAANYIHSIDACILMYVVDNINNDIGTIHDCFLVHPNQGDEVRDKYKEGFVRVMQTDPLKMFADELDPKGKIEIPYVGDLDLEEVHDSMYIIS